MIAATPQEQAIIDRNGGRHLHGAVILARCPDCGGGVVLCEEVGSAPTVHSRVTINPHGVVCESHECRPLMESRSPSPGRTGQGSKH
jgi:hypothetical protein